MHGGRFIPAHAGTTPGPTPTRTSTTVHPRACGDHGASLCPAAGRNGSSPRMRGPRRGSQRDRVSARFIPAHAGTTNEAVDGARGVAVHPRACGDHCTSASVRSGDDGSSPRMRGPLGGQQPRRPRARFIPAHAGTTAAVRTQPTTCAVHPRACGDHIQRLDRAPSRSGSSPRMRGPQQQATARVVIYGFIPAHAGTTREAVPGATRPAVHPRACGDHAGPMFSALSKGGSSPRMRGPRLVGAALGLGVRFIPAHAGTTHRARAVRRRQPVHPRACGDHGASAFLRDAQGGSSPRMRGPREARSGASARWRFIPAHAGTTPRRPRSPRRSAVHPRACGDHEPQARQISTASGSSPRMRGPPCASAAGVHPPRFIPAHAGTTRLRWAGSRGRTVHPRACGDHGASAFLKDAQGGSSPRMRGPPLP